MGFIMKYNFKAPNRSNVVEGDLLVSQINLVTYLMPICEVSDAHVVGRHGLHGSAIQEYQDAVIVKKSGEVLVGGRVQACLNQGLEAKTD